MILILSCICQASQGGSTTHALLQIRDRAFGVGVIGAGDRAMHEDRHQRVPGPA